MNSQLNDFPIQKHPLQMKYLLKFRYKQVQIILVCVLNRTLHDPCNHFHQTEYSQLIIRK